MASLSWRLLALLICASISKLCKAVPTTNDTPEGLQDGLLRSLTVLHGILQDQPPCDDRIDELWKLLGEQSVFINEKLKQLDDYVDDYGHLFATKKEEGCKADFQKAGDHCIHFHMDNKWPRWQCRFYCFIKGGDLLNPDNLSEMIPFLPKEDDRQYWVGGYIADRSLKFPFWRSSYSQKRIWNERAHFATIPVTSPNENCLAIDSNDEYHYRALDCEDKIHTVCQQRFLD